MQDKQTDEELMESYKTGDQRAFEILFSRHSGKVLGFLAKKTRSERDAQDLLQESFFKLHRSRHLYNPTLPFPPWLFSIARSVFLDHVKKKNFETAVSHSTLENRPSDTTSPDGAAPGLELESLDVLPLNQRQAVGLRFYSEATFEEIAARLSTSPENARQLVSRGVKRLRKLLGQGQE